MSFICLTENPTTPTTPNADKVRVYVGSDGILRSIDDAGTVTVYSSNQIMGKFAQYSNTNQFTTSSTSNVVIPTATDQGSNIGSMFTKPNANEVACIFNGYAFVHYCVEGWLGNNDRGFQVSVRKNGTVLSFTERSTTTKDRFQRPDTVSGSFIIPVATNDLISISTFSTEGDLLTIPANRALMSVRIQSVT